MTNFNSSMYEFILNRTASLGSSLRMLNFYGRKIRKGYFISEVDRIASYLQSIGIKKGDNVVICLSNIPNAIISFYAINKVGAIANVLHPLVKDATLREIYMEHHPKCFIMFDEFFKNYTLFNEIDTNVIICSALDYLPALYKPFYGAYILNNIKDIKYTNKIVKYSKIKPKEINEVEIKGEDVAIYMHSSGTTGNSKTACITNEAYNHLADNLIDSVYHKELTQDKDGMLMALPIFHVFGLGVCMHTTLAHAAEVIMMPKFSARYAIFLMAFRRVTIISGIPGMFKKLVSHPLFKGPWLKKIKDCFVGGDKLPNDVKEKFEAGCRLFGNTMKMDQGYGSTEAGVIILNVQSNQKEGSIGIPLKGTEVQILDKDLKKVPVGENGILYIHSSSMMKSYYDISLNKDILVDIDGKMWLNSGDVCSMDETGHIYFKEREKRLIKISGINIFPNEIEELVNTLDEIKISCALQGEKNSKPVVNLYVELNEKFELNGELEKKIMNLISTHLLKYSLPSNIYRIEKMPINEIGKVDYKKIR